MTYKYTIEDAKREVMQALKDGESFSYIRIFINDLCRGRDITWQEGGELQTMALEYKLEHGQDVGIATF